MAYIEGGSAHDEPGNRRADSASNHRLCDHVARGKDLSETRIFIVAGHIDHSANRQLDSVVVRRAGGMATFPGFSGQRNLRISIGIGNIRALLERKLHRPEFSSEWIQNQAEALDRRNSQERRI